MLPFTSKITTWRIDENEHNNPKSSTIRSICVTLWHLFKFWYSIQTFTRNELFRHTGFQWYCSSFLGVRLPSHDKLIAICDEPKKSSTKIAYGPWTDAQERRIFLAFRFLKVHWFVYIVKITNSASGYISYLAKITGCLIHADYPMKLLHLLNLLKSLAEKPIYKKWNDTKSSKVLLSSYWDELLWLLKNSDEDVITR